MHPQYIVRTEASDTVCVFTMDVASAAAQKGGPVQKA
jgi:hypothetical protein